MPKRFKLVFAVEDYAKLVIAYENAAIPPQQVVIEIPEDAPYSLDDLCNEAAGGIAKFLKSRLSVLIEKENTNDR